MCGSSLPSSSGNAQRCPFSCCLNCGEWARQRSDLWITPAFEFHSYFDHTKWSAISVRWAHQCFINEMWCNQRQTDKTKKQNKHTRAQTHTQKGDTASLKKPRASLCFSPTKAANWEHATWNQTPASKGLTQTSEQGHTPCSPDSGRHRAAACYPTIQCKHTHTTENDKRGHPRCFVQLISGHLWKWVL